MVSVVPLLRAPPAVAPAARLPKDSNLIMSLVIMSKIARPEGLLVAGQHQAVLLVAVAQQGEPLPRPHHTTGVAVVSSTVVVVTIAGVLGSCSASTAVVVVVVVVMSNLSQIVHIRSNFPCIMKYSLEVLILS